MTTVASNKTSWQTEFYKNGYPNEVIVIGDSPTPPNSPCKSQLYLRYSTSKWYLLSPYTHTAVTTRSRQQKHDLLPPLQQPRQSQLQKLPYSPVQTPATSRKRRKVGASIQGRVSPSAFWKKPHYLFTLIFHTCIEGGKKQRSLTQIRRNTTITTISSGSSSSGNKSSTKSSPIDDKDGHFLFKPHANLTQRCKFSHPIQWYTTACSRTIYF